jgi:hypothetical protein
MLRDWSRAEESIKQTKYANQTAAHQVTLDQIQAHDKCTNCGATLPPIIPNEIPATDVPVHVFDLEHVAELKVAKRVCEECQVRQKNHM